jgi:hypothetical protein
MATVCLLATAVPILAQSPPVGQSQSQDESSAEEYRAKAALLFAFAKFVQWPNEAFAHAESCSIARCDVAHLITPIVFAVIGNPDMFDALRGLTNKRIHGRPLEVIELAGPGSSHIYQLLYCDRVIIETFDRERPEQLAERHVLTIGEDEGFAETGGVLRLLLIDDHLGFEINATAARRGKLSLGSSLYKLAHAVFEQTD